MKLRSKVDIEMNGNEWYKTLLDFLANSVKDIKSYSELTESEKNIIPEKVFDAFFEKDDEVALPNTIELIIPKGFREVRKVENGKTIISIEPELVGEDYVPKDWEDFCRVCPNCSDEWFISDDCESDLGSIPHGYYKRSSGERQLFISKQRAKAGHAFIQLIRIRDFINGDWRADLADNE